MRFIFTGPECSGKTTMAKLSYEKWGGEVVWEYAREYLDALGRNYTFDDLESIGQQQIKLEEDKANKSPFIWCDTDYLTIAIWSREKYKMEHTDLKSLWQKQLHSDRYYFLCSPDFPWAFDPQREHPEQRLYLFEKYKTELEALKLPYRVLQGPVDKRMDQIEAIFRVFFSIVQD